MFKRLGLRPRLLFSYLCVALSGIGFTVTLQQIIHQNFWSVAGGVTLAFVMSIWVTNLVTHPFFLMQQMTQDFAAGHLESRLPKSQIPEINQLNRSFNRMALRLKEVEGKRSELIGDLTHELRTPLTIIRGYLEEWADERLQPTIGSFHQLIREVRRLERLVMDLQILSKAEAGHLPLHLQRVDIAEVFRDIEAIFSSQIAEHGPQLIIKSQLDLSIWADPDKTEQILLNLVGNALCYTDQGFIQVDAVAGAEQIWITVSDSGPGISETELPYIFERFWRSSFARTANPDGSGLGLAITKRLVELQGGQIRVTSQLSKGTQYTISLPLFRFNFDNDC